jgi:hypothetical protein
MNRASIHIVVNKGLYDAQTVENGESHDDSSRFSGAPGVKLLAIRGRLIQPRNPRANYNNNLL